MDKENKENVILDPNDERTEVILKELNQLEKDKERETYNKIAIQTDLDPK